MHRNGGLSTLNSVFDGPQPCHLQGLLHWWPFQPAVPITLNCLSSNSSSHPMTKPLYNYQHCSWHQLALTPIQKHRLNHRILNNRPCLHCPYCLCKYLLHHHPSPPGLLKIMVQCCTVVVIVCNGVAQIREGCCSIHWLRVHTDEHYTGIKIVLEGLPLTPPLITKTALIWGVVAVIYAPRRDLAPAPLAFGEGGGVLLQYPQATHPMLPVEVILEAVSNHVYKFVWNQSYFLVGVSPHLLYPLLHL